MGLMKRAISEAWETAKATFAETLADYPLTGPFMGVVTHTQSLINGWEKVKTPRGRFFNARSRGREIGMIKANRKDIQIMGISDEGFYVPKGKKREAVEYLNSVGLEAE